MGENVSHCEIEVGSNLYHVEPLHKVPQLIDECCRLINAEWNRSHVARMRSIEKSSENFPMSLILLRNSKEKRVVGHCKLTKLPNSNTSIFVETVIIHPDLRGKGLGKFLMEQVEEVAKRKNIEWIYLSTLGQEIFYEKLGYSRCPPVNMYGCPLPSFNETKPKPAEVNSEPNIWNIRLQNSKNSPPVPPPLPVSSPFSSNNISSKKTFMKKQIIY